MLSRPSPPPPALPLLLPSSSLPPPPPPSLSPPLPLPTVPTVDGRHLSPPTTFNHHDRQVRVPALRLQGRAEGKPHRAPPRALGHQAIRMRAVSAADPSTPHTHTPYNGAVRFICSCCCIWMAMQCNNNRSHLHSLTCARRQVRLPQRAEG
jgi:hypothetical protein